MSCTWCICVETECLPAQDAHMPITSWKRVLLEELTCIGQTGPKSSSLLTHRLSAWNIVCRLIALANLHSLAAVKCKNRLTQLPISTNISVDAFLYWFQQARPLFRTWPLLRDSVPVLWPLVAAAVFAHYVCTWGTRAMEVTPGYARCTTQTQQLCSLPWDVLFQ